MCVNEQDDLVLEDFWIEPRSYVSYLDRDLYVCTEFRNASEHILEINKITCSFHVEESLPRHTVCIEPHTSIRPGNRSPILKIPLAIDLSLSGGTNIPVLEAEYTIDKSTPKKAHFGHPDTKHVIINPKRSPEKHFFLSHKDPEDTDLASRLDRHLTKIGFIGYMAENYPRPGLDIWNEKIFPVIDDSVGMIVLWTQNSAKTPKAILREIRYAKKKEKIIIPLVEKGTDIPDDLKGTKEYVNTTGDITDLDLVKLVKSIDNIYTLGRF